MKIRSMLLIAGISELRLQLLTPKSHLSPDYGNNWQSPRKIRSMLPDSFSDPIGQLLDVSYKCQPVIKNGNSSSQTTKVVYLNIPHTFLVSPSG